MKKFWNTLTNEQKENFCQTTISDKYLGYIWDNANEKQRDILCFFQQFRWELLEKIRPSMSKKQRDDVCFILDMQKEDKNSKHWRSLTKEQKDWYIHSNGIPLFFTPSIWADLSEIQKDHVCTLWALPVDFIRSVYRTLSAEQKKLVNLYQWSWPKTQEKDNEEEVD